MLNTSIDYLRFMAKCLRILPCTPTITDIEYLSRSVGINHRWAANMIRYALTGREHGIKITDIIRLLGNEVSASRLETLAVFLEG